jgi:hypothetical protein
MRRTIITFFAILILVGPAAADGDNDEVTKAIERSHESTGH